MLNSSPEEEAEEAGSRMVGGKIEVGEGSVASSEMVPVVVLV